jgi:RNA polymerase sigma-70 factor, ECF subfamily
MQPVEDPDITMLLRRAKQGDREAESELAAIVYGRLHEMASRALAFERRDHTLQPTALVHETFLRLLGKGKIDWQDRLHFFSIAARTMRRILVDHARNRLAGKSGGGAVKVEWTDQFQYGAPGSDEMVSRLHDSLSELTVRDPRQGMIVELRFFGGLTEEEIALLLGISSRTVKRDWVTARAWLQAELAR